MFFPTFPEPLFSLLFSLLSLFDHTFYDCHPLFSLLSALVSLLSSLFSSVFPAARRLSRSELGSAAPWAERVEPRPDFIRLLIDEFLDGPRTFRRPRCPGHVLAQSHCPKCHPRTSEGLQNVVLEPPMASRAQHYANGCKALLNSASLC